MDRAVNAIDWDYLERRRREETVDLLLSSPFAQQYHERSIEEQRMALLIDAAQKRMRCARAVMIAALWAHDALNESEAAFQDALVARNLQAVAGTDLYRAHKANQELLGVRRYNKAAADSPGLRVARAAVRTANKMAEEAWRISHLAWEEAACCLSDFYVAHEAWYDAYLELIMAEENLRDKPWDVRFSPAPRGSDLESNYWKEANRQHGINVAADANG